MTVLEFRPKKSVPMAAIGAVAATYAYFLLFAQFGFLASLQLVTNGEERVIKPVLMVMGISGVMGSVLAAWFSERAQMRAQGTLVAGLTVCGLAAALVALGVEGAGLYLTALLIGLGTGAATVALAGGLRTVVGSKRLGLVVGIGTGLAYAFCNLPPIFNANASTQAWCSVGIAGIGVVMTRGLKFDYRTEDSDHFDFSRLGTVLWTLLFLALVGLDSAGFYVIQHTPLLKATAWSGDGRLLLNAVIHLGAAVLAGLAFDRQWLGRMMATAAVLLVFACGTVGQPRALFAWGSMGYPAAVSIYSAALVFYVADSGRPWIAAVVYGLAGWCGSAVGIGAVENQHGLFPGLIGVAAILMAVTLTMRGLKVRTGVEGSDDRFRALK